ncbi:MAG: hypothetical protein JXA57_17775 [Armatimonadetes bacterium]|nr:hypothetical protein [Armatimonadota bacterium]
MKPRLRGVATISDRPARIGKLKIGEKTLSKNGKEIPSKLDYIKAVDGAGNVIQAFHDVFGEKPTEFRAVFPSNDPDDFYWEAYRRYGSGTGLVCHGDGRQAIVEETGETIDCPCQHAEGERPSCKPVASLSLFLFDVPALGVFQIDTGSLNSIKNMRWFLSALPGLTGGQYAGIPFKVKVEPFQALHDGKASLAYQWKLDLLPGYKPADLRMAAQQAVESFLLPPEIAERPMIDEAKPEDLYAGLPVPSEGTDAIAAEEAYAKALLESPWPKAKKDSKLELMSANREKARESEDWGHYVDWLTASTEQVPRKDGAS